jgi:hypothetical protein
MNQPCDENTIKTFFLDSSEKTSQKLPPEKQPLEKTRNKFPTSHAFLSFSRKKEQSLFGKNPVINGKKFWIFPDSSHTFFEFFPFHPVTTVCSGKIFPTFSGIQFLSYSVQFWHSSIIILIHNSIFSKYSKKTNSIYHMKKDEAMVKKISKTEMN